MLRTAALQLARGGTSGRNEAAQIALLVAQIGSLSLSVSLLREAQGRAAQAEAARREETRVADSAEHWADQARGLLAQQTRREAAGTARATWYSTTARRPPGPTQGPRGRGR